MAEYLSADKVVRSGGQADFGRSIPAEVAVRGNGRFS